MSSSIQKQSNNSIANEKRIWTIIDIIRWGADFFEKKGIESPRLTTELILSHILGYSRLEIYSNYDKPLTGEELAKVKDAALRRAAHEPLQYILGITEFMGLPIILSGKSLIPRPETELLVDIAVKNSGLREGLSVLDIGCGSGCISIALAKMLPSSNIIGIDISDDAINDSKLNAQANEVNNVAFFKSDILKVTPKRKYDIVVSNPPYISKEEFDKLEPEVNKFEPKDSLTDNADGFTFFRRFAELFPLILNENGVFYTEIGYKQSEVVTELFENKGFITKVYKDLAGIDRIVEGKLK
jgi:release factor glutamine methyltransferase